MTLHFFNPILIPDIFADVSKDCLI